MKLLDPSQIAVVLVEPTEAGNVGSTARAMDNMGINDFRLVKPCQYFNAEGRMFSMNARYLLHEAKVFVTLDEAISDRQIIIGTTAREREKIKKLSNLHDIKDLFKGITPETKIAVVFGTEKSGLRNEHINLCNEWIYIPTYGKSSSLNLAQAVLVTLYEFSKLYNTEANQSVEMIEPASSSAIEGMKHHLFEILDETDYLHRSSKENIWSSFSDIIGRAKPDERDVRMIRGFFNRIQVTLSRYRKAKN